MIEGYGAILLIVALLIYGFTETGLIHRWLGIAENDGNWSDDQESPIDKTVITVSPFGASRAKLEGSVELNGVRWNARCFDPIHNFDTGDKGKVVEIDGLTLVVQVVDDQ